MPNYEYGQRITGSCEETANSAVHAINRIIELTATAMPDAGSTVSMLAGCALPALNAVSVCFGAGDGPNKIQANVDRTLFGAFYIIASIEEMGDSVAVGFSIDTLEMALRLYRMHTGREYTDIVPYLKDQIKDRLEKSKDVPENFKKFLPN